MPAARNFYIVAGAALFLVWLVTDYKAAEAPQKSITAATSSPADTPSTGAPAPPIHH